MVSFIGNVVITFDLLLDIMVSFERVLSFQVNKGCFTKFLESDDAYHRTLMTDAGFMKK